MNWASSLIAIFLLASIVSASLLAFFIYLSPRQDKSLSYFSLLLYAVLFWCLGYLFELIAGTLEVKLFWLRFEYFGLTFTPLGLFLFSYHYGNRQTTKMPLPLRLFAIGTPIVTYLLVLTNNFHSLIWQEATFISTEVLAPLDLVRGRWFWVHVGYAYVVTVVSYYLLFTRARRSGTLGGWQTVILLGISSAPFIFNILNQIPIYLLPRYNLSPASLGLSTVTIGLAVFRYDLLDLRPFARRAILSSMTDGVIVISQKGLIVDINSTAADLLDDHIPALIDQPLSILPKRFRQAIAALGKDKPENFLYPADIQNKHYFFQTTVSSLGEQTAVQLGYLIILRDVTDKVQQEILLREQEAFFRHLTENAQDIYSIVGQDGMLEYISPSLTDSTGFLPEEVTNRSAFEFMHADDIPEAVDMLSQVIANLGKSMRFEFRYRHKEGGWGYYETRGKAVLAETGQPQIFLSTRNISQQKTAEFKLKQSEERYRIVSELTSDFIYAFTQEPDGEKLKVEFFTDSVKRVLGYSPNQFPYLSDWLTTIRQSPDQDIIDERFELLRGGGATVDEFRLKHHDGNYVWVRDYSRTIVDEESGKIIALYGAATDITAAKLAQTSKEALQEAMLSISTTLDYTTVLSKIASHLGSLLNVTSVYINVYLRSKNETIVVAEYFSDQANELERVSDMGISYPNSIFYPLSRQQMLNQKARIVHASQLPEDSTEREHIVQYGGETVLTLPIIYKGEVVAFVDLWESRSVRVFNDDEIDIARAIAQQSGPAIENARLFQQTQTEHARLQAIIETIHDGILVVGADAQLTIFVLNDKARQLLYIADPSSRWIGRPLLSLLRHLRKIAPEAVASAILELRRFLENDFEVGRGEYRVQENNIVWQNVPVEDGEKAIGRLVVLRDVTEERTLQRMQDELVGTMVHDLRNPLAIARAALQGTRLLDDERLSEPTRENLGLADKSINHALHLVNDILDISRLESGRFTLHYALFKIDDLIQELIYTQKPLAALKNITLIPVVPDGLPLLWADWQLISRVMQNLIDNAIKFTPQNGTIKVKSCLEENGRVLVKIADDGPGIPPTLSGRLFQKFSPGPQQESGTGLGLAFCRMVLEAHNEEIWVDGGTQAGTTIVFSLSPAPDHAINY